MTYALIAGVVLWLAHWWLERPDRGPEIVKFRHGNFYGIRDYSWLTGYVYLCKGTNGNRWVERKQSWKYEFIYWDVAEAQKRLDLFLAGKSEVDYGTPIDRLNSEASA